MAGNSILIPGRRIDNGNLFYTDWMPVTGDCLLLRAECIDYGGGAGKVDLAVDTRGETGTTINPVTATSTAISFAAEGVKAAVYLADTGTTAGNGLQEQVRFKISTSGTWSEGGFVVIRIFQPIMFDSAKEYEL